MARSAPQSFQRYPLTALLGTDANVRLLRELSRHGGQLSAPRLVRMTGLAKGSVSTGLAALDQAGMIATVGVQRARLYQLRLDHPMRPAFDALFRAEEHRFAAIEDGIRHAARVCGPGILAVWLYGSVARGEDRPDSDLDIAIVTQAGTTEQLADRFRDNLATVASELGFCPSVVSLDQETVAHLIQTCDPWWIAAATDAITLVGVRPDDFAKSAKRSAAA
jgi:predicted nucleotidyltransferase